MNFNADRMAPTKHWTEFDPTPKMLMVSILIDFNLRGLLTIIVNVRQIMIYKFKRELFK